MKHLDPKAFWLFFFGSSVGILSLGIFILFVFIFIQGTYLFSDGNDADTLTSSLSIIFSYGGAFIVILLALNILISHFTYKSYGYELTPDGFKKESGFIWKKYVTIPYDRIQNVDIYRGPVARILKLSDLHIQTAGMSYVGKGGSISEGRLPGLSVSVAEDLRDALVKRVKPSKSTGI